MRRRLPCNVARTTYIVIVVSSNANVACAFMFVVEAVALFKSYFGGAFDEDAIRNNFVLIYELPDGRSAFPIFIQGYSAHATPLDRPVPNATLQVTGAVGWRREGLVYKKNKVFLDIVESENLLMSSKDVVLRCDVTRKILMKCFLSGMPDSKLGLNDNIGLEKESQIESRPTKRFNSEKTVSFVPPDGEFELMKSSSPNFKCDNGLLTSVKSVFGSKMFALGVVVKIPVPKQTAKTSFTVRSGRAKYNAAIDCLVPMFTASGLRVRFLKVGEKSGYNTVEWVRYITKAGSYEVRCGSRHMRKRQNTLEVHMTAQVKEDFVDTCACASIDLNVMSNLEAFTIVLDIVEQPVHNHHVLCIDKLTDFKDDNLL
ncbi:hypothetical protein VNO80_09688 [Phaseolus coccineus]|uniref:MHD domain-containing protein n=1 Tax=Phaseolus coccineus TaxID=3886 RepID=A0AAN9R9T1_PHACN